MESQPVDPYEQMLYGVRLHAFLRINVTLLPCTGTAVFAVGRTGRAVPSRFRSLLITRTEAASSFSRRHRPERSTLSPCPSAATSQMPI